ncbi:MAG: hypothetical protein BJ554DRAFT_2632, partial [Olpidium bornovanus]
MQVRQRWVSSQAVGTQLEEEGPVQKPFALGLLTNEDTRGRRQGGLLRAQLLSRVGAPVVFLRTARTEGDRGINVERTPDDAQVDPHAGEVATEFVILLAAADVLESAKASFTTLTGIHVYSSDNDTSGTDEEERDRRLTLESVRAAKEMDDMPLGDVDAQEENEAAQQAARRAEVIAGLEQAENEE